jgi:hypothetical protein
MSDWEELEAERKAAAEAAAYKTFEEMFLRIRQNQAKTPEDFAAVDEALRITRTRADGTFEACGVDTPYGPCTYIKGHSGDEHMHWTNEDCGQMTAYGPCERKKNHRGDCGLTRNEPWHL